MRAIGVDLAWGDSNETGVVVVESCGRIANAGWTRGVEATSAWIKEHATADTVAFIDAPLVVANQDRQRLCEKQVGQRYWKWKVSANSTNLSSPRLAGMRLLELLEGSGWSYDDGTNGPPSTGRVVSECYPYTTIVGAHELGYDDERPLYKRKPRTCTTVEWRPIRAKACDLLLERMTELTDISPPLNLGSHLVTAGLLKDASPIDDRVYKHREDLIDACLAAWTALLWVRHGMDRCQVLGADDAVVDSRGRRASIIAPARAGQRRGGR